MLDSYRQAPALSLPDRRQWHVLMMVILSSLGGLLYGFDVGVISGAILFLRQEIPLTDTELSLVVAAVLGGGSLATLISGVLADWLGRRRMLSLSTLIFLVGVTILVNAHTFYTLLAGRVIQGTGIGILIMIVPLYLVESAPAAVRGRSVTLFQLFLTGGILLAYLTNFVFASSGQWRSMFASVIPPAVLLFAGSFFLAESPRWLMNQGKPDEARKALLKTRTLQEAERDFQVMQRLSCHKKKSPRRAQWKWHYVYPFLIALAIACLNQLTGINSFLQFSAMIIQHCGIRSDALAILGSASVGLINFVATLLVIFLIDKVGRKPLLVTGTAGVALSLVFLGAVCLLLEPTPLQGYLVIAGLLVYITFFAVGPGVIVWLALSELLPTDIRSKGIAICLFVNSLVSTLFASVFLDIAKHFGLAANFWLAAGFTTLYYLLAKFHLPETQNRTLEEIEMQMHEQKILYRD